MIPVDRPVMVIVLWEGAPRTSTVAFGRDPAIDFAIAEAKKVPYYTGEIAEELSDDLYWISPDKKMAIYIRLLEDESGLDAYYEARRLLEPCDEIPESF